MLFTRYKNPIQSYNNYSNISLLNEFINSALSANNEVSENVSDFYPSINTREANDAYYIEIDLPGVKKDEVDINVEDNILTISGKREVKKEQKDENYYKIESHYGTFSRSFTLPQKIDLDKIKAKSENGVLEVCIPKQEESKNKIKKIEIK